VARITAEHNRVNPISVYVPDLQDMKRVRQENEKLRDALRQMRERLDKPGLPSPDDPDDELGGEDDDEDDDGERDPVDMF